MFSLLFMNESILSEIKELLSHRKAEDNKKAKKIAMRNNVKLGKLREEFCQKCFAPLGSDSVRVREGYKIIRCKCGKVYRFKIRTS